jgi:hypothetical protein
MPPIQELLTTLRQEWRPQLILGAQLDVLHLLQVDLLRWRPFRRHHTLLPGLAVLQTHPFVTVKQTVLS